MSWPIVLGGSFVSGALNAPNDPSYVVMTGSSGLSNERVLHAGSNISIIDDGTTITISAPLTQGPAGPTGSAGQDGTGGASSLQLFESIDGFVYGGGKVNILKVGLPSGTINVHADLWTDDLAGSIFPAYLDFKDNANTILTTLTSSLTSSYGSPYVSGTFNIMTDMLVTCSLGGHGSASLAYCDSILFS
jgi:hypothetical protein